MVSRVFSKGDFDNDGNVDIAYTTGSRFEVWFGDGDGTFSGHIAYSDTDGISSASTITAGDFDKDGDDDIMIYGNKRLIYFESNGNQTFAASNLLFTFPSTFFFFENRLDAVDVNNDSNLDIVFTNGANSFANITTMLGNGDGTFQAYTSVDGKSMQNDSVIKDFNGDGFLDLVATQFFDSEIAVYLNSGAGAFLSPVYYSVNNSPKAINAIDVDQDGDLDIISSGGSTTSTKIMLNNGSGVFSAGSNLTTGNSKSHSIAILDFDNDGNQDIVISHDSSDNTASVLLGNGDGTFQSYTEYQFDGETTDMVVDDFNKDGKDDLGIGVSIPNSRGQIKVWLQ